MGQITIRDEKCVGCAQCIPACPFGAIEIKKNKAYILENCTLCGACIDMCKFDAIHFQKDDIKVMDLSAYRGIWVFAEQRQGKISNVVFELLGEARRLAEQLEVKVSAILLGNDIKTCIQNLIAHGADEVYVVESSSLETYHDEFYCDIITQLITTYKPEIVLMGATAYGRSLAPRVASRVNTGLTADCTQLDIDEKKKILIQTRPAFGGNLMASIVCPNHRPQMATVRPGVMKAMNADFTREGKIFSPKIKLPSQSNIKLLDTIDVFKDMVYLAEAKIIVSAGRGIGESKNLSLIRELAEVLGAGIGASRAIVDAGWIDYCHQVGQTGKTVAPQIYFAFGISGAIQHLAGMSSADKIVAVNKDRAAPIFKIAHYGIVGDVLEIIPLLITEFREKLNKK